jgi:hypothetical protein
MNRLSKGLKILGRIWLELWIVVVIVVGFLDNWRNFPASLEGWVSRTVLINSGIVLAGLLFGAAILLLARRLDRNHVGSAV